MVTDTEFAKADPELAVLSAMAHGRDRDSEKAVQIAVAALTASLDLDQDRSMLYADLVRASLSEAAKQVLQAMDPAKYEFQSEFAKRYLAEGIEKGIEKGRADGQAEIVLKLLTLRFGSLPEGVIARVKAASSEDLGRFAEHILTAVSLEDVLTR